MSMGKCKRSLVLIKENHDEATKDRLEKWTLHCEAQEQALRTKYVKSKIDKNKENDLCR